MNAGLAAFRLAFQLSPIILTNGIAQNMPQGMLPILFLTQAADFVTGILAGADLTDQDNFFANFVPLGGSTLIDQDIGRYPFANQAVAANAVIANPLRLAYNMICPVRDPAGYGAKLATITALQASLAQHNSSGGTYICGTPSFFYPNCVMLSMSDASISETNQAQNTFRLEFLKPLLTLTDAQAAQGSLFSKATAGLPINGDPTWSGLSPSVGNTATLGGGALAPSVAATPSSAATGPLGFGSPSFGQ